MTKRKRFGAEDDAARAEAAAAAMDGPVSGRYELLAARVIWCPPCVSRAQGRGTVRTIDTLDGQRLALVMGDRVAGELWSIIPPEGARCSACGELVRVAFEARAARKGRGLGQSPREGAQRPLPFGRRNG